MRGSIARGSSWRQFTSACCLGESAAAKGTAPRQKRKSSPSVDASTAVDELDAPRSLREALVGPKQLGAKGNVLKRKRVAPISRRPVISDVDYARDVVRAWGVDKLHDAVVIEPYAGAGALTRALLELKNVKRVVSIENASRFKTFITAIKDEIEDPERLAFIDSNPYIWESYSDAEERGYLEGVKEQPWDKLHDNLFLASQLPMSRHGETLFVQFISTIFERLWLHKFGRIRMGFLAGEPFIDKILAPPGATEHHKLAVILCALADTAKVELATSNNEDKWRAVDPDLYLHRTARDRTVGHGYVPVLVTPKVETGLDSWDALEYCARNMFVSKMNGWAKGVAAIAPGAGNLVPKMLEAGLPENVDTPVNQLELEHWIALANVFEAWPFKPDLHDDIIFDNIS